MRTWLEVRCCCEPWRLLGWLPVPMDASQIQSGVPVTFLVRPQLAVMWDLLRQGDDTWWQMRDAERVTLRVGVVSGPLSPPRWALNSHETPIETLRRVKDFIDATDRIAAELELAAQVLFNLDATDPDHW